MTISLPEGWGPATVLLVLYALAAAVGGTVQLIRGDLDYEQFVDSLKWPSLALGGLAIGRGVAYGGQGTGFGKKEGGTSK